MTAAIFDLDDPVSEEAFLDWLCQHLYVRYEAIREMVDVGLDPSVTVWLRPRGPYYALGGRLSVTIDDAAIIVQDEWAAGVGPGDLRVVREIYVQFGLTRQQRDIAGSRVNGILASAMLS